MPQATPIEVRGLVKRYGEILAVDDVDLTVEVGDVFGYLGPNGAGKTTSLRMMLGLIRPSAGSVRLFGRDPQLSVKALEGVAGFVEAPSFYPYLNGRRNLELFAALDGGESAVRIEESLEIVGMRDRAKDKVGGYSHGMRQRLGLAAALLRQPKLLLLDEPATGLDPGGMRDMRDLIRELSARGMTGTRLARASTTSGLSVRTADDTTTTSALPTCPAAWPICTATPIVARRSVSSDRFRSDPDTT